MSHTVTRVRIDMEIGAHIRVALNPARWRAECSVRHRPESRSHDNSESVRRSIAIHVL